MSDTPTEESARERADREYSALVEKQMVCQTIYDEAWRDLQRTNAALADARKVRRALMSNVEKRDEDLRDLNRINAGLVDVRKARRALVNNAEERDEEQAAGITRPYPKRTKSEA